MLMMRPERTREEERTPQIHRNGLVPRIDGKRFGGSERSDPGIVDQNVHLPERLDDLIGDVRDGGGIADIRDPRPMRGPELIGDFHDR
jgi:hypothetical protein